MHVLYCLYLEADLHACPALPIPSSRLTCVSSIAYTLRQTYMCVQHYLYLEADLHACPALPIPSRLTCVLHCLYPVDLHV